MKDLDVIGVLPFLEAPDSAIGMRIAEASGLYPRRRAPGQPARARGCFPDSSIIAGR